MSIMNVFISLRKNLTDLKLSSSIKYSEAEKKYSKTKTNLLELS